MDKVIEQDITEKLQKKGIDQYIGDKGAIINKI